MASPQKYFSWNEFEHFNPPPAFNPNYDPRAAARYSRVTASMQRDDFYSNHTRDECKLEWRARYEKERENEK